MNSNQINLFKHRYWDDTFTNACDGSSHWGDYVELLQGEGYGETLTWKLTGYDYRNRYLNEVRYG